MSTKQRKEKEKEARRTAIVAAAERLFAAKGFDGVTMDDVALEAGLAKGTLYLYFENKESLYVAVVVRGAEILAEMMARGAARETKGIDRAYATGVAFYEFSKEYPFYFRMLMDAEPRCHWGDVSEPVRREFAARNLDAWKIVVDAVRTGIRDGTVRPDAEPLKTALFLIEATKAMIRLPAGALSLGGAGTTRDEVVYFTLDTLRHAIENRRGKPYEGIDSGWI